MAAWCVDAGVVVATFLQDESPALRQAALGLLLEQGDLTAASIIDAEVTNALTKAVRRGRLDHAAALEAFALFQELPLRRLPVAPLLPETLRQIEKVPATADDLMQVLTAVNHGRRLLTTDAKLQRSLAGTTLAPHVVHVLGWQNAHDG